LHRIVHFSCTSEGLKEQINMATMAQPQHGVSSQALEQVPLKAPKSYADCRFVEIKHLPNIYRTAKHGERLLRIALTGWGQARRRTPQVEIGPSSQDTTPISPKALRQDDRHKGCRSHMQRILADNPGLIAGHHDLSSRNVRAVCSRELVGRIPCFPMKK
jgi:hypothetical protein